MCVYCVKIRQVIGQPVQFQIQTKHQHSHNPLKFNVYLKNKLLRYIMQYAKKIINNIFYHM